MNDAVRAPFAVLHLEGWTVVRVKADLDAAASQALLDEVARDLVPGAMLALDLGHHPVDADLASRLHDALGLLPDGERVVVVEPDAERRGVLRAAGIADVHESLDAALGVADPSIRRVEDSRDAPLAIAQGDASLLATEDFEEGTRRV
jgi:hypothetical protein